MSKEKQTYNPCDDCQYSYSKNNQESGMCKICEFTYFIDRKQSEWISVEERLPVPYADVIVYDKASGVIMDSMLSTGEFVNGLVVTHWMPLPEPPKMKGGE